MKRPIGKGWKQVSFSSDVIHDPCCDLGDDCSCEPSCSLCRNPYADCECPGPTQDDEYYYVEIGGVLWAKKRARAAL